MLGKLFESRSKRLARLEREAVEAWEADRRGGRAPALRVRTLAVETASKFGLRAIVLTNVRDEFDLVRIPEHFGHVVICNPTEDAIERIGRRTLSLPHIESAWGDIEGLVSQAVFAADHATLFVVREPRDVAERIASVVLADTSRRHALILDRTRLWAGPFGEPDFAPLESIATPARATVEDREGLVRIAPKLRS